MKVKKVCKCCCIILVYVLVLVSCNLFEQEPAQPNVPELTNQHGKTRGDSSVSGCSISGSIKVKDLQYALKSLYSEEKTLRSNINKAKSDVVYIRDKVKAVINIAQLIIEAKETADKAKKIIKILTPLPYIGGAAKAAETAVNILKKPLDKAYDPTRNVKSKLGNVEKALNTGINKLESAESVMGKIIDNTYKADQIVCYANSCSITESTLNSLAGDIASAVSLISQAIGTANSTISSVYSYVDTVKRYLGFFNDTFKRQISDALNFIKNLLQPLEDLYDQLNKRICALFVCIDLIDALSSCLGIFSDIISAILDPILGELLKVVNLPVPSVPDLSGLLNLAILPELSFSLILSNQFNLCQYSDKVIDCIPLNMRSAFCPNPVLTWEYMPQVFGNVYVKQKTVEVGTWVDIDAVSSFTYCPYGYCTTYRFKNWSVRYGNVVIENPADNTTRVKLLSADNAYIKPVY